eukprot:COSAG04_NODE_9929_length_819_cov_1.175000_1_plen_40_part_10
MLAACVSGGEVTDAGARHKLDHCAQTGASLQLRNLLMLRR